MRRALQLLVLVCALSVAVCGPAMMPPMAVAADAPPTGRVHGVLFDEATGRPLPGLGVELAGQAPIRTNSDGAFRLSHPAGEVALTVGGPGYPAVTIDAIPVVGAHVTEVLITLRPDGSAPRVRLWSARPLTPTRQVTAAPDGPRGTLSGTVTDVERGRPIASARLFFRGLTIEARSDAAGAWSVDLPAGTWDLTVIRPGFSSLTAPGVAVAAGQTTRLDLQLQPSAVRLEDFTVSAPRIEGGTVDLLDERRKTQAVADLIGAEQMASSGDSDAAGALKRVTGVTIVGGRFVYVRGLGERYSSTLMDGFGLPSPDPERRVVPLDLFPTEMLESIVIQKTWSPDLPAEFGGGVVSLRSRGWPSERTASVGVSVGALTGTTFGKGLTGNHGPTDWLGVDGGHRSLPGPVARASNASPLLEGDMFSDRGFTAAELEELGESLDNDFVMQPRRVRPDLGLSASFGDSFEAEHVRGGFLAALTWGSDFADVDRRVDIYTVSGGELSFAHGYDFNGLTETIGLGAMLTGGLELGRAHKVVATTLVNRLTDNEARTYQGRNRDVATDIRISRLRWVERMLVSQQLRGEHTLGRLKLDWRYAFSVASRLEPDRKQVRYNLEPSTGIWTLSDRPDGNRRVFSNLDDRIHDSGLDLTLPIAMSGEREARVKVGLSAQTKRRVVDTRRYTFAHKGPRSRDDAILALQPGEIFAPENIGPDGFQLTETTLATDSYTARHDIFAAYAMAELPLTTTLTLTGGLRAEYSSQVIETFVPFNPDPESIDATLATVDFLPALSATWAFSDTMQLRAAVARTVSRPDLRELSPATFNDVTGGRQIFGNPDDLDRALITHVDARWEWYPAPGESLSVGAFFKHFQAPIETVVIPSAQLSVTFQNAEVARNLGIEVDVRRSLQFINPRLRDLYVAANGAWIWSRVELPRGSTIQTSKSRSLQGQSPFVVNVQLGWDDADRGTSISLLYNVFGRRISEVGALGAPDVYEEPIHQLDLVFRQKLARGFALGFKAKNLLDLPVELTQGPVTTEVWRKGRGLSLSLSKSF